MFDIEQQDSLTAYLRENETLAADETLAQMRVLAGGVSNRTVWVELPDGRQWVIKQALDKLRVEVDWYSSPARIEREGLALRALPSLLPPGRTPAFVFEDDVHHILGMRAIPEPHENWKTRLLAGKINAPLITDFARHLALMHQGSWERADDFGLLFEDRSFFETLRLEPFYQYTGEQISEAGAFMTALIAQTREHAFALVHGDYSPKNMLVVEDEQDGGEHLVMLDFEVMHWGDAAFDIGFSLAHLLSKAHHLPAQRTAFIHAATLYWGMYTHWTEPMRAASPGFQQRAVQHTLGCLLARVAGRSRLEYLNAEERERQQEQVLRLMADTPMTIERLLQLWWRAFDA